MVGAEVQTNRHTHTHRHRHRHGVIDYVKCTSAMSGGNDDDTTKHHTADEYYYIYYYYFEIIKQVFWLKMLFDVDRPYGLFSLHTVDIHEFSLPCTISSTHSCLVLDIVTFDFPSHRPYMHYKIHQWSVAMGNSIWKLSQTEWEKKYSIFIRMHVIQRSTSSRWPALSYFLNHLFILHKYIALSSCYA